MPLVILVELELHPGLTADYAAAIAANATASLRDEPGCRRFDVAHDPEARERVVLFEVYDDDAAFDRHLASPHYAAYRDASQAMVRSQTVRRLRLAGAAGQ